MGEQITIRPLNGFDIENFYPVFENLLRSEIPELKDQVDYFLQDDYSKSRVEMILNYNKNAIFGIFFEDQIIGFVWGNASYAGLGFISWLYISSQYRNKGYAKKLLAHYESYIKSKAGHVVELYCFERMVQFYKKHGYEIIGIRPQGYFKLKQYIMNKLI